MEKYPRTAKTKILPQAQKSLPLPTKHEHKLFLEMKLKIISIQIV